MTYNYNDRVTTSEGNGAVKSDGLVNCRGIVYSVLIDNAEFETHFYVHELEPEITSKLPWQSDFNINVINKKLVAKLKEEEENKDLLDEYSHQYGFDANLSKIRSEYRSPKKPERDIHKEIRANCKAKADATKPISKYTKDFIDKAKETKSTPVKPDHYKSPIDVIEFCKLNDLDFVQGNVIKYIVRYKKKNGLEDLKKAQEYINRLISDYNE